MYGNIYQVGIENLGLLSVFNWLCCQDINVQNIIIIKIQMVTIPISPKIWWYHLCSKFYECQNTYTSNILDGPNAFYLTWRPQPNSDIKIKQNAYNYTRGSFVL